MRILLFGKNGQVGWELQRILNPLGDVLAFDQPEIDFLNLEELRKFTLEKKPDLIVNASAYTAVDKAESEPEIALRINGEAPGILAEVAQKLGIGLVHYSTDYVFDGTKREPYTEDDEPNPINMYGKTKLAGDLAIQETGCPHIIIRTSWVYSSRGKNFFLTIQRLAREREELRVVDDQVGCPTWCRSIAEVTAELVLKVCNGDVHPQKLTEAIIEHGGLYNYSSDGEVSWFGFAKAILETIPRKDDIIAQRFVPIKTSDYPTAATRPAYSVLSKEKIRNLFDIDISPWSVQLEKCQEATKEQQ
jgi:dTDP-4-dehydrorhamnose reductase